MAESRWSRTIAVRWAKAATQVVAVCIGVVLAVTLAIRMLSDTGLAPMPGPLVEAASSANGPLIVAAIAVTIMLVAFTQSERARPQDPP